MVEMCRVAGNRDQLTTLLLQLAEQVLNILLIHFQERYARLSIKLNDQIAGYHEIDGHVACW